MFWFDHDARVSRCVASVAISQDDRDVELASKYRCLKPGQVAMCRGNIVSTVIQYCVWCPEEAAAMQRRAVGQLDQLYGQGLGGELWEEATALFESYYPPALTERNRVWWMETDARKESIRGDRQRASTADEGREEGQKKRREQKE